MKKLLLGSLLTVAVVFAQPTGKSTDKAPATQSGKKATKSHTKKGAKLERKGKKSSGGTTTQPPK